MFSRPQTSVFMFKKLINAVTIQLKIYFGNYISELSILKNNVMAESFLYILLSVLSCFVGFFF